MFLSSIIRTGLTSLALFAAHVSAATLQQVSNWGTNPTNLQMYIYVPDKLAAKPPVILAMHPCGGTAQGYFGMTKLPSYADQNGFIIIYAGTINDSNCWDVATQASLTHGAGGDSAGLVNMVNYTLNKYNGDATRVFATGSSSGAMMTNNLAGTYPDVFAGGAAFSGWPYGCHRGASTSSPRADHECGNGQVTHTPAEWLTELKRGYPGYTGQYPKMLIAHGTADTLVRFVDYTETMKQWSAAHNVTLTSEQQNTPSNGFTTQIYGDGTLLRGLVQQNGAHFTAYQEVPVLTLWGLIA